MNEHLLDLADQSAQNDLAFLIKAKEEAKKRMKDDPSGENIKTFNKAKAAVEAETVRLRGRGSGQVFKTQLQAAEWLRGKGFRVQKSKFSKDVRAGMVGRGEDGFTEEGLLAYANAKADRVVVEEDKQDRQASLMRLNADADLKTVQAKRMQLRLEIEQGRYLPREDHELELSKRAQFFKNEVENFCYREAAEIIAVCGGDESRLEALQRHLLKRAESWLDAYSKDMEFVIEAGDDGRGGETH